MTAPEQYASVRYLVDDVQTAVDFYTTHLGFALNTSAPAFADVVRGPLRLLLSGPASSGLAPPRRRQHAGRNRIHLIVDDLDAEINRLRSTGLSFRSDVVAGPGGRQSCSPTPPATSSNSFNPPTDRDTHAGHILTRPPSRAISLPRDRGRAAASKGG